MNQTNVKLFPHLTKKVVSDITGFKLDAYLIALEGWRRGLELKWYKDETEVCKLDRLNSSTQGKFFSLSSDSQVHYFFRSRGDKVANKTVRICQDKEKTKDILEKKGIPTPMGKVFNVDDENVIRYASDVGFPVVIKPIKGSMGKGVYTNIQNKDELRNAITDYRSRFKYTEFAVEKHYHGNEYRIYVVGDKVVGATNRIPANVIGDGESSITSLIKQKNKERRKNPYLAPKPIKVDYEVLHMLKKAGYDKDSIPPKDDQVFLREKSNLSSGGDPIDATDQLSDEIKQLAVDALKALPSIPHAGVDIIVDPTSKKKGVVLEANATAEIAFHMFPLSGKPRDIPEAMIDYYFPETVRIKRSYFYFDFNSIIGPLKTWAAEVIEVPKSPSGYIYAKKYTASGKVQNVGYMNWIRRQALKRNLSGYSQKLEDNKVEIVVASTNQKDVDEFVELCYKGSKKSRVDDVLQQQWKIDNPLKIGFEMVIDNKREK